MINASTFFLSIFLMVASLDIIIIVFIILECVMSSNHLLIGRSTDNETSNYE